MDDITKLERLERSDDVLRAKLNLETAKIAWPAVARLFASGQVIFVDKCLDLVDVGVCLARDEGQQLQQWLDAGWVQALSDAQAQAWNQQRFEMWAIVIKPWVLVQTVE